MKYSQQWELRELFAVVMLLDLQEWRNSLDADPAWGRLADRLGRPITAVLCPASEVRTAHPNYDGVRMNYSRDDKRVVDAYLFAQRAVAGAAAASI
jgi:hypothetical protein